MRPLLACSLAASLLAGSRRAGCLLAALCCLWPSLGARRLCRRLLRSWLCTVPVSACRRLEPAGSHMTHLLVHDEVQLALVVPHTKLSPALTHTGLRESARSSR